MNQDDSMMPVEADATAWVMRIDDLMAVGQVERAKRMAAEHVARNPDSAPAQFILSRVLQQADILDSALVAAVEALRLDPNDPWFHSQHARVLLALGRFRESERSILAALAMEPNEAVFHLFYAQLLNAAGQYREALRHAEWALSLDSYLHSAHAMRSILLLKVKPGDWKISEEAALRAVSLDPEDSTSHAILGMMQLRSGRVREAEEQFRVSLRLNPNNQIAIQGLAQSVMSQHLLYRPLLGYSILMNRYGTAAQLIIIFGLWAIVNAINGMLDGKPQYATLMSTVSFSYLAFCIYTWFATPVMHAILARKYPWFRSVSYE